MNYVFAYFLGLTERQLNPLALFSLTGDWNGKNFGEDGLIIFYQYFWDVIDQPTSSGCILEKIHVFLITYDVRFENLFKQVTFLTSTVIL